MHVIIPRRVQKSCILIITNYQNPASLLKIPKNPASSRKCVFNCHDWSSEDLQSCEPNTQNSASDPECDPECDSESYHMYVHNLLLLKLYPWATRVCHWVNSTICELTFGLIQLLAMCWNCDVHLAVISLVQNSSIVNLLTRINCVSSSAYYQLQGQSSCKIIEAERDKKMCH
jgi:hypothetical protein